MGVGLGWWWRSAAVSVDPSSLKRRDENKFDEYVLCSVNGASHYLRSSSGIR